jgi:hypothetical protein
MFMLAMCSANTWTTVRNFDHLTLMHIIIPETDAMLSYFGISLLMSSTFSSLNMSVGPRRGVTAEELVTKTDPHAGI